MRLHVDGTTPEQLERGLSIARKLLAESGFTPYQAARGRFDVEGWDDAYNCDKDRTPPPRTFEAAQAWYAAERAAVELCSGGPGLWQDGAYLALTDEDYVE